MQDIFQGPGTPVSQAGFDRVAAALDAGPDGVAALWALLSVETRGFGYLPDRRPKILFERHIFHSRTQGLFSASHPDISSRIAGGYSGGAAEYQRLKRAMVLDRQAALESASWGLGQVMGFNAVAIGYRTVEAMVEAFTASEDEQLAGCGAFLNAKHALRDAFCARDWKTVAFFYNGKSFARNRYDAKLADFFARFRGSCPSVTVRETQARLTYLGFSPRGIDGVMGEGTRTALLAFQTHAGLQPSGAPDDGTLAALRAA